MISNANAGSRKCNGARWLVHADSFVPPYMLPMLHWKGSGLLSQVGGGWLGWWMVSAAAVSQVGQFEV